MKYLKTLAVFTLAFTFTTSAFAGSTIQGFLFAPSVMDSEASSNHRWDREIVYASPIGHDAVGAGMRIMAMELGWYFIENKPDNLAPGKYQIFTTNMANIDGGLTGFEVGPQITVPEDGSPVEGVEWMTDSMHYSAMYDGKDYTQWSSDPWIHGHDIFQTFVAKTNSITRVGTRLADKNAGPGTHHLTLMLNFAIYEKPEGQGERDDWPPQTWKRISPIRQRFLPGTMDPIIHTLDVNYLSSEVPTVPGKTYAVRIWADLGNSESNSFAVVARPDEGDGYPHGTAWVGTDSVDYDIFGYITGGEEGTVTNFAPTNQEKPELDGAFVGSAPKQGQTFTATGTSLAGVELMYSVGCNPNPRLPMTVAVYDAPGGKQIGPSKTTVTVTDLCQGRMAAFWPEGEVPLTEGKQYYLEFDGTEFGEFNAFIMSNDVPGGEAWQGGSEGTPTGGPDMTVSITEYTGE